MSTQPKVLGASSGSAEREAELGKKVNKPIPGRPCKATSAYIALLEINPKQGGHAFAVGTQARLHPYFAEQTGTRRGKKSAEQDTIALLLMDEVQAGLIHALVKC